MKEDEDGKLFGECLVRRWRGKNDGWGLGVFSSGPPKSLISKMGRKLDKGKSDE